MRLKPGSAQIRTVDEAIKALEVLFIDKHRKSRARLALSKLRFKEGGDYQAFQAEFLNLLIRAEVPNDEYKAKLSARLPDSIAMQMSHWGERRRHHFRGIPVGSQLVRSHRRETRSPAPCARTKLRSFDCARVQEKRLGTRYCFGELARENRDSRARDQASRPDRTCNYAFPRSASTQERPLRLLHLRRTRPYNEGLPHAQVSG